MECLALPVSLLLELLSGALAGKSAYLIFFFFLLPRMWVSRCIDISGRGPVYSVAKSSNRTIPQTVVAVS
jgi:hypothetical protein